MCLTGDGIAAEPSARGFYSGGSRRKGAREGGGGGGGIWADGRGWSPRRWGSVAATRRLAETTDRLPGQSGSVGSSPRRPLIVPSTATIARPISRSGSRWDILELNDHAWIHLPLHQSGGLGLGNGWLLACPVWDLHRGVGGVAGPEMGIFELSLMPRGVGQLLIVFELWSANYIGWIAIMTSCALEKRNVFCIHSQIVRFIMWSWRILFSLPSFGQMNKFDSFSYRPSHHIFISSLHSCSFWLLSEGMLSIASERVAKGYVIGTLGGPFAVVVSLI